MFSTWLQRLRTCLGEIMDGPPLPPPSLTPPPLDLPPDYPERILVFFMRPARPEFYDEETRTRLYESAALRIKAAIHGHHCVIAGIVVPSSYKNTYTDAALSLSQVINLNLVEVNFWDEVWVNDPASLTAKLVADGLTGPVTVMVDQQTIRRMAAAANAQLPVVRSTGDLAIVPFAFHLNPRTYGLEYILASDY